MSTRTVGLVGFRRINRAIHDYLRDDPAFEVDYVFVRSEKETVPAHKQVRDPTELAERPVDLCVEAATPAALADHGAEILRASDLAVLSGSAFADDSVQSELTAVAEEHGTDVYLPHAALLGIDGLVDAGDTLDSVSIEATKAPSHLDFDYTDEYDPEDVDGRTVLYDGPVRGLCTHFPRNFNSHAAVALASLGLDDTRSTLVVDPEADGALHVISASGDSFDLEIHRDSRIEGVTGDYTLVSTWGSIRRILDVDEGLKFV